MDSVIFNILFLAVILMAIIFLIIGNKQNFGMTKKQKTMLVRILAATVILLVLQSLSAETFNKLKEIIAIKFSIKIRSRIHENIQLNVVNKRCVMELFMVIRNNQCVKITVQIVCSVRI